VRFNAAAATPQSLYNWGVLLALSAHMRAALLKMMQSFGLYGERRLSDRKVAGF
jgi:hypothetical protein